MPSRHDKDTLPCRVLIRGLAVVVAASAALLFPARPLAFWNVAVGDAIRDRPMVTIDGSRQALLGQAHATVFVICRPDHDRSLQTLRALALLEKEFAGKPVRFVAVTSDSYSSKAVRTMMRQAGVRMEVLVDKDDQLAGDLGVDTRPAVAIADAAHRLAAYQHFLSVNMGAVIQAQIEDVLGRQRALVHQGIPPAERDSGAPRAVVASTSR